MSQMYDCIVVGGGPAGSTVAALVAEAGLNTLLLERDKFPRFHVGESLMPETYWTLRRLGVLEKMKHSAYPKKFSVQFVNHEGRESAPFYFHEIDDRENSQTWQVLRSEFDQMLFQNAAEKGAECRQASRVLEVLFDGPRAHGVRVQSKDGKAQEISGRVIVDATGLQSMLANRLGLREEHPGLRKGSIWAYYRSARRDEGIDEGTTVILHTRDRKCWFWSIPLPNDITSIGVVGDADYLLKDRGTIEAVFEEELCNCPAVLERLMNAKLVSEFRAVRDFSYVTRKSAGDGWVLVGDAHGFLDPIYSSGVFLALKSGEMAADCIVEGLAAGDLSAAQLGKWVEQYQQGMTWIRKLVYAFYTDGFSFGQFIREFPHHKSSLTNLLVGKVFHSTAGDIFQDLDPWLEAASQRKQKEKMAAASPSKSS